MCIDFFQRIFYPDESNQIIKNTGKKGLSQEETEKLRQIRIEKYKDTKIVKKIKKNRKKQEEEEKKKLIQKQKYNSEKNNRIIQDWYN